MPREAWGGDPGVKQACEGGRVPLKSPEAGREGSLPNLLLTSGSALLHTGRAAF